MRPLPAMRRARRNRLRQPAWGPGARRFRRHVDTKRRADARRRVHLDASAARLDEVPHGGQAETGAAADLLGREERLEDPLEHVARHAHAAVGDAEPLATGESATVCRGEWVDTHGDPGLGRRIAFQLVVERIAGVHQEVEDDLMQVGRVLEQGRQLRRRLHDEGNPRVAGGQHQIDVGRDDLGQVHVRGLVVALAPERQ